MAKQGSDDSLKSQSDFYRKLNGGQIGPLYLLEGEEAYQRDQALKKLIEKAVDQSVYDFNVTTISIAQGNLDEALALARQYPMISSRRVVVVTGFESLNDDRQLEQLKDYLRDPAPTTALVFVSEALDNRRNIATMLRKTCEVVSFAPLDEREAAPRWLADYVSRAGCFIEPSAAAYLIGMVGTELRRLSSEADKLVNYVGGKGRIGRAEIDELVRYSREHSNFELTDAIIDGNRKRALELLDHILANPPENPQTLAVMLVGAIASNYRKMLAAKELMRQNAPNSEVAKAVGMPPFAVGRFNEKVRRKEMAEIERGIARIAQTDVALKTSMATPRLQIELLICELCRDKGQAPGGRIR
ncbi:MAG TPA: DNA polymerase III subunit delta [Blastocatellia bacterium]|nr:DNA polymerase III subunit delta [Blastocatellia bacterium]